jgi:MoaA/NifB/PqqE/SkfB family radical SAM enzyme
MKSVQDLKRLSRIWASFRQGKDRLFYFPSRMWIEITNHCNLKCPCCPNQVLPQEGRGFMSPELFKNIIDQMADRVHDLNLFHRGEPLLHPSVSELIGYAQSRGIICRIHTNATLLSESLSGKLLNSGLEVLSFSFDGVDAPTYEKNRYPAKFDQTLGKIEQFLILKRKEGKTRPTTILQVMGVEAGNPGSDLKDLVARLKSRGLNRVVFRRPHNWGGAIPPAGESSRDQGPGLSSCTFPWYALVVYWDGRVGPCPQDFFGRMILGDLTKSPLEEIWNGPAMQGLRNTFSGVPAEYLKSFVRDNLFRVHRP